MKRGEIYWADLAPRSGSEQKGRRPVLVVSHDAFNQTPGWSSVGYLKAATGPFAGLFHRLADTPALLHVANAITMWGLTLVGLGLILGLCTQMAKVGGMGFLLMFYLSQPPWYGLPQAGAEGNYLIINKNLIELLALATLFAFRTHRIAGLDIAFQDVIKPLFAGKKAAVSEKV